MLTTQHGIIDTSGPRNAQPARQVHLHSLYKPHDETLRSLLDLLSENVLERDGIGREFRDAFPELVDSHGVLVEVEAEQRLVFQVGFLGDIQGFGSLGIELLRDRIGRVVKVLEKGGLCGVSVGHWWKP